MVKCKMTKAMPHNSGALRQNKCISSVIPFFLLVLAILFF